MPTRLKPKVLLGKYGIVLLLAAILAGLALGFAGTTTAYRYGWLHQPGGGPVDRMSRDLDLTPSQREEVAELMEDTRGRVGHLRREFQRQRRKVLLNAYIQIRASLTPDQQKRFDQDFVPPRFRSEAEQLQQQTQNEPPPWGNPGAAPATPATPAP
jgi:Spy/CpxP family protein refolding chaperone